MIENYQIPARRKKLENISVFAMEMLAVCCVMSAVFHFAAMDRFVYGEVELNHTLKVCIAGGLILVSWNLRKRFRSAWVAALVILLMGIMIDFIFTEHVFRIPLMAGEICVFLVLLLCGEDFCRKGRRGKIVQLSARDKERVREIVCRYGENPGSYLALEDDKTIYMGERAEGIVPYGIVGDVVVVSTDPVCAPEDFETLLLEFRAFCHRNLYACVFLSVTQKYIDIYKKNGYGYIKCGEEPRINVQNFSLAGKARANIRAEINHAVKDKISVEEYDPGKERDKVLEARLQEITRQWLKEKHGQQLVFTLGTADLDHPMDKRYFYAKTEDGNVVGFIVFIPFAGMRGYMADVIQRSQDAPRSVTEIIMYRAIEKFSEEGIDWVSLGLAPLARMDGEKEPADKLLFYIYEHFNRFYHFKNLYKSKEKYGPDLWIPSYFTFDPKIPTPEMAYAVLKIQTSTGLGDYIRRTFQKETDRSLED